MPSALRDYAALAGPIFDGSPDGIVLADADRTIVLANPAACAMFGYEQSELCGRKTLMLYESAAEFARQGARRGELLVEGRLPLGTIDFRSKDGRIFPGETVVSLVNGADGAPIGFLAIVRDISQRLAANEALETAQRRLEDAVEAMDEGFALFDAEDRLVLFNEQFSRTYSRAAPVIRKGATFTDIVTYGLDRGQYDIGAADKAVWLEQRLDQHRDPPPRAIEQTLHDGRIIRQAERRTREGGTVGVRVDVTEARRMEQTLDRLTRIGADPGLSSAARLQAMLELGAEHVGLPIAVISRIEGERYEIVRATSPDDSLQPGDVYSLGATWCTHVYAAMAPFAVHHATKSGIANHPCYETYPLECYIGAPIMIDGAPFGTLGVGGLAPRAPFLPGEIRLIGLLAQWIGTELARERDLVALREVKAKLERQTLTDELTGIANRRQFMATGRQQFAQACRYGRPLSVLMLDLDHFKQVNDRHGHDAGDRVLRETARLCERTVRKSDLFTRLGGEEFAAILPDTDGDKALALGRRLNLALRDHVTRHDGNAMRVTASIGVAVLEKQDGGIDDLLRRADAALYIAKNRGRDRTIAA